jgi:hypothetical protein
MAQTVTKMQITATEMIVSVGDAMILVSIAVAVLLNSAQRMHAKMQAAFSQMVVALANVQKAFLPPTPPLMTLTEMIVSVGDAMILVSIAVAVLLNSAQRMHAKMQAAFSQMVVALANVQKPFLPPTPPLMTLKIQHKSQRIHFQAHLLPYLRLLLPKVESSHVLC